MIPQCIKNKIQYEKMKIKSKTINETVNNYGNINLGLDFSKYIVLSVKSNNNKHNLIPFVNARTWYAYIVSNVPGNSLNLITDGTVEGTVYYIEIY